MKTITTPLLGLILSACTFSSFAALSSANSTTQITERYAQQIYQQSRASGMAMVVIDGNQKIFTSKGETRPGNHLRPRKDSVIRIASLTKLMTSEALVKLSLQGKVSLTSPLSRYAPKGMDVPTYHGHAIQLQHLATHTAGLPRELPGGRANRPVFIWPERATRWRWLQLAHLKATPGTVASYSNLGFDLLADALQNAAGQPYSALLKRLVTRPMGMKDTTYTPSPDQCRRLMVPSKGASPCNNTLAAIGSGGLYSTPDDMGRWMQQFLTTKGHPRQAIAQRLQRVIYPRSQLNRVIGMDVAGPASGLGLGWVHMAKTTQRPALIEKTGGGGGFQTYMAMDPTTNVGVFVVVTRTANSLFSPMSRGVNELVSELARQH